VKVELRAGFVKDLREIKKKERRSQNKPTSEQVKKVQSRDEMARLNRQKGGNKN
jgi:hypothetical protein